MAIGVGWLTFIDFTLDYLGCLNILKGNFEQSAQSLNLGDGFWFQLDNDLKYTAPNVKLRLLYIIKNQLHTPTQSPDLNPIGQLWELLERKLRQHYITSKDMLKSVIMMDWNNISSNETRRLVQSMPKWLTEVLKHKGYPTRY